MAFSTTFGGYIPLLPDPFNQPEKWADGKFSLDKLYALWHNSESVPKCPLPHQWLQDYVPYDQRKEFLRRAFAGIHRYLVKHRGETLGYRWWCQPIGGLCRAYKLGHVGNSAWGFSTLQKGRARKLWKKLAEKGYTRKEWVEHTTKSKAGKTNAERIQRVTRDIGPDGDRYLPPSQRRKSKVTQGAGIFG